MTLYKEVYDGLYKAVQKQPIEYEVHLLKQIHDEVTKELGELVTAEQGVDIAMEISKKIGDREQAEKTRKILGEMSRQETQKLLLQREQVDVLLSFPL